MSANICGCDSEAKRACEHYPECAFGRIEAVERAECRYAAIDAHPCPAKHERLLLEIQAEFLAAECSNAPMHSLHEGLSVIEEEVHELRLEVYKNPRKHPDRNALARKEAIQVAAMALRLLNDVL